MLGTGGSEESRVRSHDTATVRVLRHPAVQRQSALLPLPLHPRLLCHVPLTQSRRPAAGRHREVEVSEILHYTTRMILSQLYLYFQCDVFRAIHLCMDLICLVVVFYRTVRALETRLRSLTPRTRQVHHAAPTPDAINIPHSSALEQLSTILVHLNHQMT